MSLNKAANALEPQKQDQAAYPGGYVFYQPEDAATPRTYPVSSILFHFHPTEMAALHPQDAALLTLEAPAEARTPPTGQKSKIILRVDQDKNNSRFIHLTVRPLDTEQTRPQAWSAYPGGRPRQPSSQRAVKLLTLDVRAFEEEYREVSYDAEEHIIVRESTLLDRDQRIFVYRHQPFGPPRIPKKRRAPAPPASQTTGRPEPSAEQTPTLFS